MKIQIIPNGGWVEHHLDQSVRVRESLRKMGFEATLGGEPSTDAVLFVQFPGGASIVDDPEPGETARRILAVWDPKRLVLFETPRGPFSTDLAAQLRALAVVDELDLRPLRGEDAFPGCCGFYGRVDGKVDRVESRDSAEWLAQFRDYLQKQGAPALQR